MTEGSAQQNTDTETHAQRQCGSTRQDKRVSEEAMTGQGRGEHGLDAVETKAKQSKAKQ